MERLCERPGCSDPASVGYGIIAETQVFWLEERASAEEKGVGLLCGRHAEAMVVPRGWTLDDRRDPELHLFKPPSSTKSRRPRGARKTQAPDTTEQLRLGDEPSRVQPAAAASTPGHTEAIASDDSGSETDSWTPAFRTDDDLDGLLSATSPLLSRAFRGDGRPRIS